MSSEQACSRDLGATKLAPEGTHGAGLKQALRQSLRAERRQLTGTLQSALWGDLVAWRAAEDPAFAQAEAVLLYLAHENEVPTTWLIHKAAARGLLILLPRRVGDEWKPASWLPGTPLYRSTAGIWEPTSEPFEVRQKRILAFVPVVAWDMKGARLGRGAAAYDRMLFGLRERGNALTVVGLGYEFQRSAMLPVDPWDVRLDQLITERRKLRFRGRAGD